MKISDPKVIARRIGFEVPVVANWHFRPTERREFYMAPLPDSASSMRGVIVNGEWECFVQLNVSSDDDTPIRLEELEDRLVRSLEDAIAPFQEQQ